MLLEPEWFSTYFKVFKTAESIIHFLSFEIHNTVCWENWEEWEWEKMKEKKTRKDK